MKLSDRIEEIFSHAVALQQNGRLRNTVYGIGRMIYILNQDHMVMLRFRLRKTDRLEFDPPISFSANDYDSKLVDVEDGRIIFTQEAGGFTRAKSCVTPDITPEDVRKQFKWFKVDEDVTPISLHSQMLPLLNEELSHIEFSCVDGEFKMIQRNIYSGTVAEITRKDGGGLFDTAPDLADFEPIGLRTGDFLALFTFVDSLEFRFFPDGFCCADSKDPKMPMRVIINQCQFDELGGTE